MSLQKMVDTSFVQVLLLVAITTTVAATTVTSDTAAPSNKVSTVAIGATPTTVIPSATVDNNSSVTNRNTTAVINATFTTVITGATGNAPGNNPGHTTPVPGNTPINGSLSIANPGNTPSAGTNSASNFTATINATLSSTLPSASANPNQKNNAPGTNAPGTNATGTNATGTTATSTNTPGTNAPGTNAPGTNAQGTNAQGTNPPSGTAGTTPTTTPPPTTEPTTPSPCLSAKLPSEDNILSCADEKCAKAIMEDRELYIKCNKPGSKAINDHPVKMANFGEEMAMRIAQTIETKLEKSDPVNESVVIVTDELAMGSSVIDSSMYTNTSRGRFYFPNMSQEGVSIMLGGRVSNSILYPKKYLPSKTGYVRVGWSISEVTKALVPESEIEQYRDIVWRLPVADMKIEKNNILIGKDKPKLVVNSRVISFSLYPKPQSPLSPPLHIAFKRMKNSDVKKHRCYYWMETSIPTVGHWSSIGCAVVSNNDTHTVCSFTHMSTFVVLSEVYDGGNEDARTVVKIIGIVFCIFAMAALIGTLHLARKLQCLDNDRVYIHINLCVTLLIGYFLFIIGTLKSDTKVLSEIIAFALHFCQLAPLVWLCLEAVYFFNIIHPIFNYEVTNTRKLYTSMGWALTAAFAGASAGYDLPHNGKPFNSEIIWIFIDSMKVGYFIGPFIFLIFVNVFLRAGLMIRLLKYTKTSDDDKTPFRIKVNILTTMVLIMMIFITWCFGVKAVNNTEDKKYHFTFLVFYCLQALLVFIIYGWQNEEMWSLNAKTKEAARKIEERKITFTYIP